MERSKSFIEDEDLTKCGICRSTIQTPKALPCLHTFCLTCLQEVIKDNPVTISCLLCQEEVAVPPGGAEAFRNNFFIEKLKERKAIWEMKQNDVNLSCSCCGEVECETEAHCSDCQGFLCSKCTDIHETIAPLRNHRVFTVKELRSGKVDDGKDMKEEHCYEHKDQLLRFFCNTCGIPVCRDCTVLEHSRPEHQYVHLETVVEGQMADIKQLVDNCKEVVSQADSAMEKSDQVKTDLKAALNKAHGMLWRATEYAKAHLLENLEDSHNALAKSLKNLENERCGKIETNQTTLLNLKAKLHNAMEMGSQVIKSGSKHDLALSYTTLSKTLDELQHTLVVPISESLSEVEFRRDKTPQPDISLGYIRESKKGRWILETEIGVDGARSVTVSPTGDIVVTDETNHKVQVYATNGDFKFNFDTSVGLMPRQVSKPWGVTVSKEGQFFVTDQTPLVKIFTPEGEYLKKFHVKSMDGYTSVATDSQLRGIVIDRKGDLLVGNSSHKYITKHTLDGTQISCMKVTLTPAFLATTPENQLIISPSSPIPGVQLWDENTGEPLLTIPPPTGVESWYPWGICCSDDDIIYINSYESGNKGGVYSFTVKGQYLGCVTNAVTCAEGLAIAGNDDNRLLVAQYNGNPLKIFCQK